MSVALFKKFLTIQFLHTALPGYDAAQPADTNLGIFSIEPTLKTKELIKNLRFQFRQKKGALELFYSGKPVSNINEPLPPTPQGNIFSFIVKLTDTKFLDDNGALVDFNKLNAPGKIRYFYCLTTANPITAQYGAFTSGSLKTLPAGAPFDYKYLQLNRPNTGAAGNDIQLPVFNRGLTLSFTEPSDPGFTGYNATEKFTLVNSVGQNVIEEFIPKVTDAGGTTPRIEINGMEVDNLPAGVYKAKLDKAFVPEYFVYINTGNEAERAYGVIDVELSTPLVFNKALPIGANLNDSLWYNLLYYTFS